MAPWLSIPGDVLAPRRFINHVPGSRCCALLGKPEQARATHRMAPQVVAPCAPLTVLLVDQQEGAWKGSL